jgi:CRP-like cAMP-binding protein
MISDLVNTSLFDELSFEHISNIAKFCTQLCYGDGDILISENDTDHYDIFVLIDGQLEILTCGNTLTSDEVVLSKHEKSVFGEISWLNKSKRTATLRCHGEVDVIRINGEKFDQYMEENPVIGFSVMRKLAVLLSKRLEQTDVLLKQILWNTKI